MDAAVQTIYFVLSPGDGFVLDPQRISREVKGVEVPGSQKCPYHEGGILETGIWGELDMVF